MKDVAAVPGIDLDRYLGTWFEICRLPLKWEDADASDITATYSKAGDGGIRVENRCLDKHGTPERSIGVVVPQEGNNAKLKVSFLPAFLRWIPFTAGDYWVLAIAPDYSIALVGTPDRKHLWLISRTAALPSESRTIISPSQNRRASILTNSSPRDNRDVWLRTPSSRTDRTSA